MFAINDQEFTQFADYVRHHYGIHFKAEKKSLIAGRLNHVLADMNMRNLTQYMEYLAADKSGRAVSTMLDKITTNYTYFMREADHFQYFRDSVLPYLEKTVKNRDMRVWCAASSTGEEPYTLAMIMDEYFGTEKSKWDTKILATDISQAVLNTAKAGIYSKEKIAPLPEAWKKRYFNAYDNENVIISERIREEVIFSKINLMEPAFPFKKNMHAVFCRNVMIYFDNETKDRLTERMYDITEPGGFLFIGHAEGLNREKTRYKYIMPAVYRKE